MNGATIFSTVNAYTNKSRFCYSYKPPGLVESCCTPTACATNEHIGLISSLQMVTFNSTRTTERSLLLYNQQQYLQATQTAVVSSIIQSTIVNSAVITSTLQGQRLQIAENRYLPYKPYVYPCIPSSVVQLQMATANAGVPMSFFTAADCKGVQSVTT
jgi:hypothetical protein